MNAARPHLVIRYRDPQEGWEGFAVIDSLVDGRAAGGVRVTETVTESEVVALARAMTLKLRSVGLPCGGVKYGIQYAPGAPGKVDALERFFRAIKPMVAEVAGFGPDMGTTAGELDEVATRIGLPTRHAALLSAHPDGARNVERYHESLRQPFGPLTILEARTGVGVAAAVEKAAEPLGVKKPLTIALQGFGQVGRGAAHFLERAGHTIVGIADLGGYYRDPSGLSVSELLRTRDDKGMISGAEKVRAGPPESIYDESCDALVLAAQSHSVHAGNVDAIQAKLLVEAGNLTVTKEAEEALAARGIPVVPDFISNAGAIALVAGIIVAGWETDDAERLLGRIGEQIGSTARKVATEAVASGRSMRTVAAEAFS